MKRYRIEIDRDACSSCGVCLDDAPNTFDFDDDDIVMVVDPEGDDPDDVLAAAEGCPTEAIILIDEKTGKRIWPE
jgi:ferredoxin